MALKSNRFTGWLVRHKERIGILAVGHTAKQVEEFLFDYTLYPAVIATMGAVWGGLVMTALAVIACYLYILFYDWAKKDWLGLELLKKGREGEAKGIVAWLVQRAIQKGDWVAFLGFSVFTDAFVTTVYMRQGAGQYNGLSSRDWKIFWWSVAVSNLAWVVVVSLAIEVVRFVLYCLGFA